ncbi:MAG: DUF86 domain-containing protein [Methanoregula sp.]
MDDFVGYDVERIGAIYSDIQRYIRDFNDLNIDSRDALNDKRNFYATSMILFSLLNRVFDLGSEIAIAHNLGIPSTYREIFVLLQKNGLIDNDLAKTLIGFVTYRNLLSHEYHGITAEKLFDLTKKISIVREFAEQMQTLQKQQK